jgi:hypothetical protein
MVFSHYCGKGCRHKKGINLFDAKTVSGRSSTLGLGGYCGRADNGEIHPEVVQAEKAGEDG